jgi:enoyl-CoA hydratase/carnithine racemase
MTSEEPVSVTTTVGPDFVAIVEIHRPPNNFFDLEMIRSLVRAYDALDADDGCRAILLCSEGKHFCAGADFSPNARRIQSEGEDSGALYREAVRLFTNRKPVVAVVQGGAIGGGLGLACSADFRFASPESRFAANFSRLGFHHGFGLSATLPDIVGRQHAMDVLYRGHRVTGEKALTIGLADRLAAPDALRDEAQAYASEIAQSAPLAVEAIRSTLRRDLPDRVRAAVDHELAEQGRLGATQDWAEGIRASMERRPPVFRRR